MLLTSSFFTGAIFVEDELAAARVPNYFKVREREGHGFISHPANVVRIGNLPLMPSLPPWWSRFPCSSGKMQTPSSHPVELRKAMRASLGSSCQPFIAVSSRASVTRSIRCLAASREVPELMESEYVIVKGHG